MKWLRALLWVAYPFAIFFGLRWLEPRTLALAIAGLLLLRVVLHSPGSRAELRRLLWPALLVTVVVGATFAFNEGRALLFVPVAVNVTLLIAFGRTLRNGPSMIETFARLQHPDLSPERVRHCRMFTQIWCGFFLLNAAVCAALAWHGDVALWTLHTGLLSYVLIGLLLATEVIVRWLRFGRYEGGVVDPMVRPDRPKVGRSG
jgi:uncharacterized membrane protein